ncbi:hypothetical protein GUJ93_ZPchr0011g27139 [Zizania palustris]|uniref:Uncharacterized protein n=1 Tax=Zizania palustris TaxID=103762 RepID=A0A8J5WHS7_ZIZPA|nr:hypothetical protein GUJ93_ZPchr0011g28302 [Zizania palustris]KAG8089142.1 hypothetical protein GUJ93_ZPchr0011g27139 [Zizania palustris]
MDVLDARCLCVEIGDGGGLVVMDVEVIDCAVVIAGATVAVVGLEGSRMSSGGSTLEISNGLVLPCKGI